MERVGVEAVVAGLSSFLGDMKKVDSSIQGLIPGTKLLENAFGFLGDTVSGFVNFALNTLAHALGELVADAVEFVIQKLGELVEATIEAGAEFQTLELRLETLNFNAAVESGMDYNEATAESIKLTKEQLDWLQKLAVLTPYDAQDIANVYTLARSYGFVDDEAQTLTESITNFASGMGLGNVEIERIIVNFGQMVQQGKVTQREMNDLARGSFVPVNDILKVMSENTGVAMDAMDDFRKTGESVPAFMEAFIELVDTRFSGSAEKMAQTFQGASANLKDLVKSIGGMNIVKPILDVIGQRIAKFITTLTEGKNWDKLVKAAHDVGNGIATIVNSLLRMLPSAEGVADGVVNGMERIAEWLNKNRMKIFNFFMGIKKWIDQKVVPAVQELIKWLFGKQDEKGAFQKFGEWLGDKFVPAVMLAAKWIGEVLVPFLKNDLLPIFVALLPLAGAIGTVLALAFGGEPNQGFTDWIHGTLIPGIEKFTQWILDNKEEIALWVDRLVEATIQLAIFMAILGAVISVIANVAAAFLDWIIITHPLESAIIAITVVVLLLASALGAATAPLLLIGALVLGLIITFTMYKAFFLQFIESFKEGWIVFSDICADAVNRVQDAIKNGDWIGAGQAIIMGLVQGVTEFAFLLIDAVTEAASAAVNSITSMFGVEVGISPNLSGSTVAPSTTNSNTTNTSNYNLNIQSSANTEPIVQDFNMLSTLHGGR